LEDGRRDRQHEDAKAPWAPRGRIGEAGEEDRCEQASAEPLDVRPQRRRDHIDGDARRDVRQEGDADDAQARRQERGAGQSEAHDADKRADGERLTPALAEQPFEDADRRERRSGEDERRGTALVERWPAYQPGS
jgi:hypothetical protein